MNKPLFYQLNIWIAEQLKTTAPNLYKYRDQFGKSGEATFLPVVIVNTAAPLLVYLAAYPYTFYIKFTELRPTWRSINLRAALQLGNLGIKFFWLQIAGIIQFMTANILISNFFTPEMVNPYQIAYRYMSLVIVFFTVICMPFWNATPMPTSVTTWAG